MKYLALIYSSEKEEMERGEAYSKQVIDEYMAFEGWLAKERPGKKIAGDALLPTTSATTVRIHLPRICRAGACCPPFFPQRRCCSKNASACPRYATWFSRFCTPWPSSGKMMSCAGSFFFCSAS
jgi:hypothetical protein